MVWDSSVLLNFATSITYLNNNAAPPPKYSFQPSSCHMLVSTPPIASMAGCLASNSDTHIRAPIGMVLICYLPSKRALPKSFPSLLNKTNESLSLSNACTTVCLGLI